ncbi:MAG: FIST signal transduction protein [Burkholderiales bacterium]
MMKLQTFCRSANSEWSEIPDQSLDSATTLVLLFGAPRLSEIPDWVAQITALYPRSQIVGCSTSGEIHGSNILDDSLVVGVAQFERTKLRVASVPIESGSSFSAGETLGKSLNAPDLRAVLLFSDGLRVNGSELVRGINTVLPGTVVVTGGLAGDADRFERTWVIKEGGLFSGFVTATGLYGDALRVGHGSKGGWDVFGVERLVTRSEANVLYELDGKPALQLYKEYLGERASGLPATGLLFPLALRDPADAEKRLVRTILAVDEATQSLTFAGDIPLGYFAQLMCANFDRLIEGAGDAALSSLRALPPSGNALAIAISCVGRRLVLGEGCEEEIESTLNVLPPNSRQIGFYSYGEISPYANGQCDLHNQTMTLTTLDEI